MMYLLDLNTDTKLEQLQPAESLYRPPVVSVNTTHPEPIRTALVFLNRREKQTRILHT